MEPHENKPEDQMPHDDAPMDAPESATPEAPREVHEHHRSLGPALGIIILILVIALGALYFFGADLGGTKIDPPKEMPADTPGMPDVDPVALGLESQSTSTELVDIEADIEATDLDSLDTELADMEAELEAAINDMEAEMEAEMDAAMEVE